MRGQGSQDYVGHFRGHFSRWCLLLLPTVPGPEAITCPCQITGTWKPASLCAAGEEKHHNLSSSTAIHLNWATSFLRIRTLGIYQQFKKHWLHPKGQAEQTEKKLWRWIKKPSEIASKEEVLGKKESSGKYIRERSGTLTLGAQQACINHMEVNEWLPHWAAPEEWGPRGPGTFHMEKGTKHFQRKMFSWTPLLTKNLLNIITLWCVPIYYQVKARHDYSFHITIQQKCFLLQHK